MSKYMQKKSKIKFTTRSFIVVVLTSKFFVEIF